MVLCPMWGLVRLCHSTFEFGTQAVGEDEQTLYAKAQDFSGSNAKTPTYLQISDNRGSRTGWSLRVVEKEQTSQTKRKQRAYQGASLSLKDPVAISSSNSEKPIVYEQADLIPDAQSVIATAPVDSGAGTWVIRWGGQEDLLTTERDILTPKVQLIVPKINDDKLPPSYTITLNWILSNLPIIQ